MSHVEKNLGIISRMTEAPFLMLSVSILASGWSSVPRYFIIIFSASGRFDEASSNILAVPLP